MFILEDSFGPGAEIELHEKGVLSGCAFGAEELEIWDCDFVETHSLVEHAFST